MISQVVYTRTLHNNPLFLHGVREQGGKASHCATNRISPAFCKAALCSSSVSVCVRSFGVMWKCGELNGSGISPVLWPVTYGPAHDRQGTACFICGQRGLFTFLFQLFSPLPALSCRSPSVFFYLNPIRLSLGPTSAVLPAAMQRFTDSLLRVWAESFNLLPVWFTFVGHIQ